ncbi:MAG: XdhC family protein [Deltaproteobacteria bacterium]|nr:XdhC family protein [Deltaproteobacteria bacterium]
MDKVYRTAINLLKKGEPFVLATVIQHRGSSPRGAGSKMVVKCDRTIIGSVGGGKLEARVQVAAEEVFKTGLTRLLDFSLTGADAADTNMICGGDLTVYVELLNSSAGPVAESMAGLSRIFRKGGRGILVTLVAPDLGMDFGDRKCLILTDGQVFGNLPDLAANTELITARMNDLIRHNQPALISGHGHTDTGLPFQLYLEPILAEPRVIIFGGGHVSYYVAQLADQVGFRVVVMDDRVEFANVDRFPMAGEVVVAPYEGVVDRLGVSDNCYLVIVTRGHVHDLTVVAQALKTSARYVGMIGSRRKTKLIFDHLLATGFTPADIGRVHSPIGLAINAETPEEIAVSIVAELIQVRGEGMRGLLARHV